MSTGSSEQMDTNATMDEAFRRALYSAALADYFFIGEQTKVGDERETIASEPVAGAFLDLFDALGIGCSGIIDDDNAGGNKVGETPAGRDFEDARVVEVILL